MKTLATKVFKGRDGWEALTMTETNANGKAWRITTHKTRKGVSCSAIEGEDMGGGSFSYDLFGGKRLELANMEGVCNENKVRAVHATGLAEFEKQIQNIKPEYVLTVGQVIFTDHVHSESNRRVIYEVIQPGHFKTVTLDGKKLHRDDRVKNYAEKFGIGVYYNEGEILPLDKVNELVNAATIYTQQEEERKTKAAEVAKAERLAKIEAGKKIISAIPSGIEHVIIAQLEQDESDPYTDYHGSRTAETVYLSWSKNGRDLFPEMRKAAAKFEPTQIYSAENPDFENREKYSMGAGYYLGQSRYSGWNVSKTNIDGRSLEALQIAAAEGRFYCNVEDEAEEVAEVAPIETEVGKINIIEYGKGLAVVGDTKPIKDQLKALGGRFNFRLTCGAGWVFPMSKLEDLKDLLTGLNSKADKVKEELKDEVKKTLDFLASTDIEIYGEVREGTKEAFKVQDVPFVEVPQMKNNILQLGF
jgi:hypothetical protein